MEGVYGEGVGGLEEEREREERELGEQGFEKSGFAMLFFIIIIYLSFSEKIEIKRGAPCLFYISFRHAMISSCIVSPTERVHSIPTLQACPTKKSPVPTLSRVPFPRFAQESHSHTFPRLKLILLPLHKPPRLFNLPLHRHHPLHILYRPFYGIDAIALDVESFFALVFGRDGSEEVDSGEVGDDSLV